MVEEQKEIEPEEKVIEIAPEKKAEPTGIKIEPARKPDVAPPLLDLGAEAEEEIPPAVKVAREGKIPISPGVIKPLFRFEGLALAETTNFAGFIYTEEDLDDIAQLVEQTGLEATPVLQLFLALSGMHASRGLAFFAWRRAGKPEGMQYRKGE